MGVHVRTSHSAARDGRLAVVYDTRTTFRRLRPKATLARSVSSGGLAATLAEFRTTVPAELFEAAQARFPAAPPEATLAAFDEWLPRIADWFRWAAKHLPAKRKMIVLLRQFALGTFINLTSTAWERQYDATEAREHARIERERQAVIDQRLAEISEALERLALKEEFTAVIAEPAPVRLGPNSKGKRVARLAENGRYRIPNDNLFASVHGARKEIWAYGLRNAHRLIWDVDPAQPRTPTLLAFNIGLVTCETVVVIHKGANSGCNGTTARATARSSPSSSAGYRRP